LHLALLAEFLRWETAQQAAKLCASPSLAETKLFNFPTAEDRVKRLLVAGSQGSTIVLKSAAIASTGSTCGISSAMAHPAFDMFSHAHFCHQTDIRG
jgi:hypothetical protein